MKIFIKIFYLLVPYIWKTKKSFFAALRTFFYIFLKIVGTTLSPVFLAKILESESRKEKFIFLIFISLLISWILQNICSHLSSISFYRVTNEAIKLVRFNTIKKIRDIANANVFKMTNSEIIYACERVPTGIVTFMNSIFIVIFPNIISLISCLIFIIYTDKILGVQYSFFCFVIFLPSFFLIKQYTKSRFLVWKTGDTVRISQNEILQNTSFSKTNKKYVENLLKKNLHDEAEAWYINNNHNFFINIIFDVLFFLVSIIFLYLIFIKSNNENKKNLVIFSNYVFLIHRSYSAVISDLKNIIASIVDLKKIVKILELPSHNSLKSTFKEEIKKKDITDYKIVIKDVSFFHKEDNYVIKNFNFEIKKGEKIAIQGKSGSGKSTLCKIIVSEYFPTHGDIFLYEQNKKKSLEDINIEYVNQDSYIFSGSIAENLFLNGKNIPKSIENYFINRMNEKVYELGKNLSIGERKRIIIARAIAKKSNLLILDESFSGLDTQAIGILLKEVITMTETLIVCSHDVLVLDEFSRVVKI